MMVHDKVFELGESVEVSPDDAGFKGSWYEAKIITLPKNPKSNRISPKKQQQYFYDVEYKTLLEDEDENVPLTERIRADRIRPVMPPRGDFRVVELGDVVEAFYRDGWWVGVVTKVLEPSGKFRVTFSDPPDQIECGVEDLRIHLQWENGVWSRPQEANQPDTKEKISEMKKRKRNSLASRDHIKRLPKDRKKDSVSSSFGDVNRDSTNGEKDIKGNKEAHINKKKKDGISVSNRQSHTNSTTGSILRSRSKCCSDDSVNRKRDTKGSKETFLNKILGIGEDANAHSAPRNVDSGRSPNRNESESLGMETWDRAVASSIHSVRNASKFINRNQEQEIVKHPEIEKRNNKFISPNQEKENLEQTAGVEENEREILVQESEIVDQAAAVERNHNIGNENDSLNSNKEMEIVDQAAALEKNGNNLVTKTNQEIANVGKQAASVDKNGNKFVNQNQEMEIAVGHSGAAANIIDYDQNLPFVKTSPLWNIIASMQVFQAIPQRPHFRGLADKHPVHCLEGKAIGYMLIFHDIVKNTAKSQLDTTRESVVQRIASLSKLEKNGFDVKGIRDRLTTLLERKDELSTIKNQLMEHNKEKEKIVEVIDELQEKIKEMQEKCAEAMSRREKTLGEIAHCESKVKALQRSFDENVFEFKQLAAAPW